MARDDWHQAADRPADEQKLMAAMVAARPAGTHSSPPWKPWWSASLDGRGRRWSGAFRKKAIAALAKRDSAADSKFVTDRLSCWTAVTAAGCDHFLVITSSGPQAAKWVPFQWVNTALGDSKRVLVGTYHHASPKHA